MGKKEGAGGWSQVEEVILIIIPKSALAVVATFAVTVPQAIAIAAKVHVVVF